MSLISATIDPDEEHEIRYNASPTLKRFHLSTAFVRGVRGPVGSGKSTAMACELWRRANEQKPAPNGRRYSRFAIVRQTYPELRDTTLKTWLDWFPEERFGSFNYGTMTHHITIGDLEAEFLFRALDRPEDAKKVLSLELTGAWVNEARETSKSIIDALGDRVGRYPSQRNGGCTWRGLILDTNSPDSDHWWYILAEEERPQGWEFFAQPPGVIEINGKWRVNPAAENLENLEGAKDVPPQPGKYYETRAAGKSRDYVLVYYANQYGFVKEGKPVFPDYVDTFHCAKEEIKANPKLPIWVGIDFGLTPAAVFGQRMPDGRWFWIDELVTEDCDTVRFAELLKVKIRSEYPGYQFTFTGDPAGDIRAQTDSETPFSILRNRGIDALPALTNDPIIRHGAVAGALRRVINGHPGFVISPRCKVTRKGMAGGYHYKRVQVSGDDRFHDKPDKNKFSHPCEAGEYMLLGAGEGDTVIGTSSTWNKKLDYSRSNVLVADTPQALAKLNRTGGLDESQRALWEKQGIVDRRGM